MWRYPYPPEDELKYLEKYKKMLEIRYKLIESKIEFVEERIRLMKELMEEFSKFESEYLSIYYPLQQQQLFPYPPYLGYTYPRVVPIKAEPVKLSGKYRVVVASQGPRGLDDMVSPVFARAPYFTVIDIENGEAKKVETLENRFGMMSGGAGIAVSQHMGNLNADVVVAGSFGPNSLNILQSMGVKILTMPPTTIKEVLKRLSGK